MSSTHVVIVGAGFGGLTAAKKLAGERLQITIIDKHNHHLFQPLLYQVATAGLSPAEIAVPIRHIVRSNRNISVQLGSVTGINPTSKEVYTNHGAISYDFLILATGAQYNYFGHSDWEKYSASLKTVADATEIRRRILTAFELAEIEQDLQKRNALMTFVLVGGGPTGVEMAGAIAELAHRALAEDFRRINPKSAKLILVEAGPRILSTFSEALSNRAQSDLQKLHVDIRCGARVESIDENGVVINGKRIESRTVLWCAGVKASPVGDWLQGANVDNIGRIKVDATLEVPGFQNIFVIGDAAHVVGSDGSSLPGIAPVAMQQGAHVAKVIVAKLQQRVPQKFEYRDKGNLATIGRASAIAEFQRIRLSGRLGWWIWLLVHIYYLIGFKNRLFVLIQWAWSYLTFQRGARLITPRT